MSHHKHASHGMRKHTQDTSAGYDVASLNPLPHLQSVKSLADAKREWPWLVGSTGAVGALAYGAWMFFKKGKR